MSSQRSDIDKQLDEILKASYDEDQPTCPYCQHRVEDLWDHRTDHYYGDGDEWECAQCDKTFWTTARIVWTSEKMEDRREY